MKTNAPKRKVFQDAVDLISPPEEMINPVSSGQTMISVKKIVPFHNHPFRLYEGKRLDDMVESIREHGVLIPVIVQKIADGYEMLSGHNRWNAAKVVGIKEIPAIIKDNLTEREAYVYVIETNMLQRSFDDLLPSEKAAVLAERYEKVMCQGRRNDILEEIAMLNGVDMQETCGHDRAVDKPPYISNHLKYNGTFLVKINRGHYNEKGHGLLCHGLYHSF